MKKLFFLFSFMVILTYKSSAATAGDMSDWANPWRGKTPLAVHSMYKEPTYRFEVYGNPKEKREYVINIWNIDRDKIELVHNTPASLNMCVFKKNEDTFIFSFPHSGFILHSAKLGKNFDLITPEITLKIVKIEAPNQQVRTAGKSIKIEGPIHIGAEIQQIIYEEKFAEYSV